MSDGRWDPAIVHGDLSPDGQDMLISVEGLDWQQKDAADALRQLTVLPHTVKSRYNGQLYLPCTWAVVLQISRVCADVDAAKTAAGLPGMRWHPEPALNKWIYDELMRRHTEDGDLAADLSGMERAPFPHQKAGAFVAGLNRRFYFADDPGTGKTMTMLMSLAELEARGHEPFPAFVVCPASVVDPWMEEIEKVFPSWPVVRYGGPRRRLLSSRYKVYVMSWDVFRADMHSPVYGVCQCGRIPWTAAMQKAAEEGKPRICETCDAVYEAWDSAKHELPPLLDFLPPQTLVLDEAHALCNVTTRQSTAAWRCAKVVPNILLASGTPITHDVGGFWAALRALDIRSFPNHERYKTTYADTSPSDYGSPTKVDGLTTTKRDEFYTLLQGSMRHIAKADVLKDLPPKTYATRVVQIPPAYRAAYDEMQYDMLAHIPDTDEPLPVMSTLAQIQRLTQLASSACDVEIELVLDARPDSPTFGEEIKKYLVTMREPCWKADELMAVMGEMGDEPVLCFAPHTQLINIAGARAEKAGYTVGYIRGGQTRAQRTKIRQAFQAGEIQLLCANISAGGVGLTLHRSHTAVFLERSAAFWQDSQAEDRIHRAGQTEQVTIIDIVAANTIESRIRELMMEKAQSLADLVRDERIVRGLLGGQPLSV